MNKFLTIIILLVPFITYAQNNGDYCKNSNQTIQNLINSNDYDEIYYFLNDYYIDYHNKCGNTDNLKSLIDKYILLTASDSNTVSPNDNLKLSKNIRPILKDDKYNQLKKNIIMDIVKNKKSELYHYQYSSIDDDTLGHYNNELKDLDEKFISYYKIDKTKFCGIDGEGFSICSYKYTYNKPLKLSGTLTVSNLYNQDNTNAPNYFKTSFKANNLDIDFSKFFIVPINYKLNTKIPKNYLQTGAVGEITFNVDFILDKDSIIKIGKSSVGDIVSIYVKDLNINSVKNIKYYDKTDIESYAFSDVIETYELTAKDSYTNLRDKPNGKIVYQINHNDSSGDKVYFYEGYKEPGIDGYRLGEGYPPSRYLYNYYKILGFSKPISNNWFFVTYFPKNSTKPVFGYIYSSEINHDADYSNIVEWVNNIENINTLSYKEIFDILYDFIGEDVHIKRLNYVKNQKLQTLVDRYVSFLLSDNFIMRDDVSFDVYFINSLYYYVSDDNYYKIINKYLKDFVIYDKLYDDTLISSCNNTLKSILSSKNFSNFKLDFSQSAFMHSNDNDLFINNLYGIYDANKFIKDAKIGSCNYRYTSSTPFTIQGKILVDSKSGNLTFSFNDFLSKDINVYPLNYNVNNSIYSNLLNKGYLGKVSYDVELTLSQNTIFIVSSDVHNLFVDNIQIKGAKDITYYNKEAYKPSDNENVSISYYNISSKNGSTALFDFPNGKVITNLKNGSVVYSVNFDIDIVWENIMDYNNNSSDKYTKVIFFPDGVNDGSKALSGYIDLSLLKKVEK